MKKSLFFILCLYIFIAAASESAPITTHSEFNSCDETHCVFNLTMTIEESGYALNNAKVRESQDIEVISSNCDNSNQCLIMVRSVKKNEPIHLNVTVNGESKEIIHINNIPEYYQQVH